MVAARWNCWVVSSRSVYLVMTVVPAPSSRRVSLAAAGREPDQIDEVAVFFLVYDTLHGEQEETQLEWSPSWGEYVVVHTGIRCLCGRMR
jgi:hypothetical protein